MTYILNTPEDQRDMLAAIGVESIDDLFEMVPAELRLTRPLDLPPAMGEMELSRHLAELARQNRSTADSVCFLGGGAYDHFVPAVVDFVASRSEFYTAYTPYQAEASQGSLQAFFEYQTLVTQLTGMDVSNASMYDGASATAEAVIMALAASRNSNRVVLSSAVHPDYRQVVKTYLAHLDAEVVEVPFARGQTEPAAAAAALGDRAACLVVQHPNFFGCLEEMQALAEAVHKAGGALIVIIDPISVGLLQRPSDYGADIVVAEGQPLGIPLQYGGPYLGMLACREAFVRRVPGRLVGQTTDRKGRRCFVLTLQTREQHIRREKATSNICTNQGLLALRATVYLAALGPQGLRETAELCLHKAHYAAERIDAGGGSCRRAFDAPVFKEFVVRVGGAVEPVLKAAQARGVMAGVPLVRWYPELEDGLLVAVTEKRTQAEIDLLAELLNG